MSTCQTLNSRLHLQDSDDDNDDQKLSLYVNFPTLYEFLSHNHQILSDAIGCADFRL